MGSEAVQNVCQKEVAFADHHNKAFTEFQKILWTWCAAKPLTQILPHLLLGNAEDANNLQELKRRGVTHVINLASCEVKTGADFYGPSITYTEWPCEDAEHYDIMQHYDEFAKIADDVASGDTKGLLLVHCAGGINRSGTLRIAYYAMYMGLPFIQCTKTCKKLRGRICTNPEFQKQLFRFALQRQLPLL
jgi:protein-tyrosine phosphatase